eukprot:scaffold624561_cov22-Prasinocladus_malaysianus.AAC.2
MAVEIIASIVHGAVMRGRWRHCNRQVLFCTLRTGRLFFLSVSGCGLASVTTSACPRSARGAMLIS